MRVEVGPGVSLGFNVQVGRGDSVGVGVSVAVDVGVAVSVLGRGVSVDMSVVAAPDKKVIDRIAINIRDNPNKLNIGSRYSLEDRWSSIFVIRIIQLDPKTRSKC